MTEKFDESRNYTPDVGAGESYPVAAGHQRRGIFKNFHLVVDHQPSPFGPNSNWSNKGKTLRLLSCANEDLDPILPHNRTWRTYSYVTYWASDAFVVSIWQRPRLFLQVV